MTEKKSYKEIFGKQSPLRLVSHVLAAASVILLIVQFIVSVAMGEDPGNRRLSYLAVSALFFLPYLFELIFRRKINDSILFFYVFYAVVAGTICACQGLYQNVVGVDKAVHGIFGYVGCVAGLIIVCKLADYDKLNPAFVGIVCFAVSLCCGACWELIEFTGDTFLGQTSQGPYVETAAGEMIQSKTDTMLDIFANFIGAIVFELHYIIHKLTRKNLLIGLMVSDFSQGSVGKSVDSPEAANE